MFVGPTFILVLNLKTKLRTLLSSTIKILSKLVEGVHELWLGHINKQTNRNYNFIYRYVKFDSGKRYIILTEDSCLTSFEESRPILCGPRMSAWRSSVFSCTSCILQGKQGMYIGKKNFICQSVYRKKGFNPWQVYKPCTTIPFFLLDQLWGLDCYGRFLSRELHG